MTGPEHYRMAEVALTHVSGDSNYDLALLKEAQVHATLAAAAATATAAGLVEYRDGETRMWDGRKVLA